MLVLVAARGLKNTKLESEGLKFFKKENTKNCQIVLVLRVMLTQWLIEWVSEWDANHRGAKLI